MGEFLQCFKATVPTYLPAAASSFYLVNQPVSAIIRQPFSSNDPYCCLLVTTIGPQLTIIFIAIAYNHHILEAKDLPLLEAQLVTPSNHSRRRPAALGPGRKSVCGSWKPSTCWKGRRGAQRFGSCPMTNYGWWFRTIFCFRLLDDYWPNHSWTGSKPTKTSHHMSR